MDTSSRCMPIDICRQKHQKSQSPIYENKVDPKIKEGCCHHYDSSFANVDPPANLHVKYKEKCFTKGHISNEPQLKWSRNNIAMTMEYFQPISSTSTPVKRSSYGNHTDYSYAYYEPGAAMRHTNIPTSDELYGSSTVSSPKSMRALLSKPKDDNKHAKTNSRHTYTTRYGTQENIYEDVSTIGTRPDLESSVRSLNEQDCTKTEFQDILHNHYRVLEDFNLSVEELLLTSTAKTNVSSPRKNLKRTTRPRKTKNYKMLNELVVGEDSGFSGSSSGASYIGNLRNYKTALTRSLHTPSSVNFSSGCRSTDEIDKATVSETNSFYMQTRCKKDKTSGPLKTLKLSFWNKR